MSTPADITPADIERGRSAALRVVSAGGRIGWNWEDVVQAVIAADRAAHADSTVDASPTAPVSPAALKLQEIKRLARDLNGVDGLQPEVVFRARPTGHVWIGCQCDQFRWTVGESLDHAMEKFFGQLTEELGKRRGVLVVEVPVGESETLTPPEAVPAPPTVLELCAQPECPGVVEFVCTCQRCSREPPGNKFYACAKHSGSKAILKKHSRTYPDHVLRFTRLT